MQGEQVGVSMGFAAPQAAEQPIQFMQFNQGYTAQYAASGAAPPSFAAAYPPPPAYGGGGFAGAGFASGGSPFVGAGVARFEDEPPLLEELGIDIPLILRKTRSVLNPVRSNATLLDDGDLGGPLVFCFMLGAVQLLMGKVNFGYILGWSVVFMLLIHYVTSLIVPPGEGVEFHRSASLLGYSLIPVVLLSVVAVVLQRGPALYSLAAVAVLWATTSASGLMVHAMPALREQRLLVAYPCFLAYSMYAVLALY